MLILILLCHLRKNRAKYFVYDSKHTILLLQKIIFHKVNKSGLQQIVSVKKNDSENSDFLGFIASNITSFFSGFSTHFNIVKFSYRQHAFDYFQSLFKLEKKTANCQNIADHLSCLNQQSINHFINSDHWSYKGLMEQVAMEASAMFTNNKQPVALLIDEVGFRKKGKMSACVSRQYLSLIHI